MRWPKRVLVVFVAGGVLAGLKFGAEDGSARIVLLALALWVGWATMAASVVILLGTALERLRKRPYAIAERPVARHAALITSGALLVLCAILATIQAGSGLLALAVPAGGLGAIAWRVRTPSLRSSVILLVLAIALFEIPREVGYLSVSWYHSDSSEQRDSSWSGTCPVLHRSGVDPDGSGLTGDIGELVFPANGAMTGPAVRFHGTIDASWPSCLVPLHKTVRVDTQIAFVLEGPGCSGSGTISIHLDLTVNGVASCRNARELAAKHVRDQLVAAMNQL